MDDRAAMAPLPADLPEDWNIGQIIAPTGEEVGLSHQHGYNYLMEMVNKAQRGVNQNSKTLEGVIEGDLLKLKNVVTVEGGAEMTLNGGFGSAPYEIVVTEEEGTTGVTSFNGRTGAVMPQPGDYAAEDVGAVPNTCTINGKPLTGNITIDENKYIRSEVETGTFNGVDKACIIITGPSSNGNPPFVGIRVTIQPDSDTTVKAFLGNTEVYSGPVSGAGVPTALFFALAFKLGNNSDGGYVLAGSAAPASWDLYVSLGATGSYTAEIVRYGPFY